MPTTFQKDTHVTVRDPDDGAYEAVLDPSWNVWSGPNGGYVAAILVRALRTRLPEAGPLRSLDVTFAASAEPGPARVEASPIRRGGSVDVARARLVQQDAPRALARATFGRPAEGPAFQPDPAPDVPGFDEAPPLPEQGPVEPPTFTQHVEYRQAGGEPPGAGEVGASMQTWMRMAEPTPYEEPLIAFLADAWMAAIFAAVEDPMPVPSLDLSIQVHELPDLDPGDPLLGGFRAEAAREGYAFEDGQLWTPNGRLVARVRQTRRVLS